jgi:flavin prenyltransferase
MKYIVAITGASGVLIGKRLAESLSKKNLVYAVISNSAKVVARYELKTESILKESESLKIYQEEEIDSIISSGSNHIDAMTIAPCSMKTLSAVANGFSYNLITRAADVCIKEKRPLVIVPRESPLSPIHLENMLKLSKIGVFIVPPVIQFYSADKKQEQIDYVCGKVLDCLKAEHTFYKPWSSNQE